jgi:carbonyl reductase 1
VKGWCEKYDGIVYLTARDVGRGEAAVAKLEKVLTNSLFNVIAVKTSKLMQHIFI